MMRTTLFGGIPADELEAILEKFNIKETIFRRGEILARQDEPCNRLIFLLTGAVKGEMSAPSGKIVKVDDIIAPNPLAILFLFGPENRFPVQATATENGTALIIPKHVVLRMLSGNEQLLKNYLDISASFAVRLSHKLHFMSFRTIRQKIAMYMLWLSKKTGEDTFRLDKTHTALAEYFGVSRQALERELKSMVSDRLISLNGKQIHIVEKSTLANLVSF